MFSYITPVKMTLEQVCALYQGSYQAPEALSLKFTPAAAITHKHYERRAKEEKVVPAWTSADWKEWRLQEEQHRAMVALEAQRRQRTREEWFEKKKAEAERLLEEAATYDGGIALEGLTDDLVVGLYLLGGDEVFDAFGLVLSRKARNRLAHALNGNTTPLAFQYPTAAANEGALISATIPGMPSLNATWLGSYTLAGYYPVLHQAIRLILLGAGTGTEGLVQCGNCWTLASVGASGPDVGTVCVCGAQIGLLGHHLAPGCQTLTIGSGWHPNNATPTAPAELLEQLDYIVEVHTNGAVPDEAGEFSLGMLQLPFVDLDSNALATARAMICAAMPNRKLYMAQRMVLLFGLNPQLWGYYEIVRRLCELGVFDGVTETSGFVMSALISANSFHRWVGAPQVFRAMHEARAPPPNCEVEIGGVYYAARSHASDTMTKLMCSRVLDLIHPGWGTALHPCLADRRATLNSVRGQLQPIVAKATLPRFASINIVEKSQSDIRRWGLYAQDRSIPIAYARRMMVLEDRNVGAWWASRTLDGFAVRPYLHYPFYRVLPHVVPAGNSRNASGRLAEAISFQQFYRSENAGKDRSSYTVFEYIYNATVRQSSGWDFLSALGHEIKADEFGPEITVPRICELIGAPPATTAAAHAIQSNLATWRSTFTRTTR